MNNGDTLFLFQRTETTVTLSFTLLFFGDTFFFTLASISFSNGEFHSLPFSISNEKEISK
jgi:hypothetical protein